MADVQDDALQRATDAVLQRIADLQLSKAELGRATKMSFKTVDKLVEDRVLPTRVDKRRDLALGLGWPPDAIQRLLAGETPENFGTALELEDAVADALRGMAAWRVERPTSNTGPDVMVIRSDGPPLWIEVRTAKRPRDAEHAIGEMLLWAHRQPADQQKPVLVLAMLGEVDGDRVSFARASNIELVGAGSVSGVVDALADRLVRMGAVPGHALAADADSVTGDARRSPTRGPRPEPNE